MLQIANERRRSFQQRISLILHHYRVAGLHRRVCQLPSGESRESTCERPCQPLFPSRERLPCGGMLSDEAARANE